MKFAEAYDIMMKGGRVRRKGWGGFWYINKYGEVVIHLKGGYELVNVSDNLRLTIDNTLSTDWEEV